MAKPGTPMILGPHVVAYKVHKEGRSTFGLSFGSKVFEGWAEDGIQVEGNAVFPRRPDPIPFSTYFMSGGELIFSNSTEMQNAFKECVIGDVIEFHLKEGRPLPADGVDGLSDAALEGAKKLNLHQTRERNSGLAAGVRRDAKGRCTLCEENYAKKYPKYGENLIEAHHIEPLNKGVRISNKESLVALCANCHRMVHAWMRNNASEKANLQRMAKEILKT